MDLPGATEGLLALRESTDLPVVPICGRDGRNVAAVAESLRWIVSATRRRSEDAR